MKSAPIDASRRFFGRSSSAKRLAGLVAAALLTAGLLIAPALAPRPLTSLPQASAACPDAEVDFARGREEAPGVGAVGQAFINSLEKKKPRMTTAASCPNTKLVLGGHSLGAAAADVVIAMNQPGFGYTDPLPPPMDQHVAAVALFGNAT